MYTLMRLLPAKNFILHQLPSIGGALAIAEIFYKFGSFLLEATAFLATWFILDVAITALTRSLSQADQRSD